MENVGKTGIMDNLLHFFFPKKCQSCLSIFSHDKSEWVCNDCLVKIAVIKTPKCKTCGRPFFLDHETAPYQCGDCITCPPPFDLLRSYGLYDPPLRDIVHRFKYNNLPGLAEDLSGLMIGFMKESGFPTDFDLTISTPVHVKKLMARGYDPASLLTQKIAEEFRVPYLWNALIKTRETPPQVTLKRKDRLKNVKGAFSYSMGDGFLQGKKALLVDDVYTTGATIKEGAAVLKKNGAERVYCITVARAF